MTSAIGERLRARPALLVAAVLAALVAATAVGLALAFGVPSIADLESAIERQGSLGLVVFVVVMATAQVVGVPALVFMAPAGVLWSAPVAVGVSWSAMLVASVVGFAFARRVGRAWVAPRIPPRLAGFDARLARGGIWPIVALRLATGGLAPADWLLGLSAVRWRSFLVGTALGLVPSVVMGVVAGGGVLDWALGQPPEVLGALGALCLALIVAGVAVRHRLDAVARRWGRPSRRGAPGRATGNREGDQPAASAANRSSSSS